MLLVVLPVVDPVVRYAVTKEVVLLVLLDVDSAVAAEVR